MLSEHSMTERGCMHFAFWACKVKGQDHQVKLVSASHAVNESPAKLFGLRQGGHVLVCPSVSRITQKGVGRFL